MNTNAHALLVYYLVVDSRGEKKSRLDCELEADHETSQHCAFNSQ
jgi:hypothetical protein